jgi:hypothetical protein
MMRTAISPRLAISTVSNITEPSPRSFDPIVRLGTTGERSVTHGPAVMGVSAGFGGTETGTGGGVRGCEPAHQAGTEGSNSMAKRARKRKGRKKSAANHGKRPNS